MQVILIASLIEYSSVSRELGHSDTTALSDADTRWPPAVSPSLRVRRHTDDSRDIDIFDTACQRMSCVTLTMRKQDDSL